MQPDTERERLFREYIASLGKVCALCVNIMCRMCLQTVLDALEQRKEDVRKERLENLKNMDSGRQELRRSDLPLIRATLSFFTGKMRCRHTRRCCPSPSRTSTFA